MVPLMSFSSLLRGDESVAEVIELWLWQGSQYEVLACGRFPLFPYFLEVSVIDESQLARKFHCDERTIVYHEKTGAGLPFRFRKIGFSGR